MTQYAPPSFRVLLVEDNQADQEIFARALQECSVPVEHDIAWTGEEAVDCLVPPGPVPPTSQALPDLVFLDLNLPGLSGKNVLRAIRAPGRTRYVPVVVLTTSGSPGDVRDCYELGCNCFLRKPSEADAFIRMVRETLHFWSTIPILPRE